VIARDDDGHATVVEFAGGNHTYNDEVGAVVQAKAPRVVGGRLTFDTADYREDRSSLEEAPDRCAVVRDTWLGGINYRPELRGEDGEILRAGLREPQVGALHAIAAHWTLSSEPALIVMPTGTGKTEVMIAGAVAAASNRLLVIVPTDALRHQTALKFASYGVLSHIGVIDTIPFPVVGVLAAKPSPAHFARLDCCNVVVTTMASLGMADEETARDFAGRFSHVFFDESHHIKATTWTRFQNYCGAAHSLMLTATPFREDGKPLEGRVIYNYPLSSAQRLGYFNPISFVEVFEPDESLADRRIAEAAVNRLREDLAAGHDHLLMARAQTIDAATRLYDEVYAAHFGDLNPVLIHSQTRRRKRVLDAIRRGDNRIIVCVDMFGEGFDLPQLKVAALHSIHKSLGVTLQFIGRFARTADNVGQATFVANTAEDGVPESLESLYFDDPDWNLLLPDLSYDAIDPQVQLSELVQNLRPVVGNTDDVEISTFALRPKCSAKIYRTDAFYPERFADAFRRSQHIHQPQVSREDNLLVLVVNQQDQIDWTDSRDIALDTWDLYIAYYDAERRLLYIHSSRKGDTAGILARHISLDPVLVDGEETFKVFSGLRRLTLHSVGLSSRSRNVRYQMFAGLDVRNAIDPVQQQSKLKSVITGVGYEEGERRSVGCSRKGKIWSMQSGSLAKWRGWCDLIGAKLSDLAIGPDDFLRYTLIPTSTASLPDCEALLADWPDQLFESTNFRFEAVLAQDSFGFHECQIDLVEWHRGGTVFDFRLVAGEDHSVRLRLTLQEEHGEESYGVTQVGDGDLQVAFAGRRMPAAEFFSENPPLVRLENGAQLAGNLLLTPQEAMGDVFDRERINVFTWAGVDITKESRWKAAGLRNDSVQQHMIEYLEQGNATFIIDDDDTGEAADIVAIEEEADRIVVYLWHCKYSSGVNPGHRLADLYEVCGQAQKSVKWSWSLKTLLTHLSTRETKHSRGRPTRFIRGSLAALVTLRKSARRKFVEYHVGIVQPGLSVGEVTPDQLALLGSTNAFVQTVTDHPLSVVGST